jgi:2'-5' RNA ligase
MADPLILTLEMDSALFARADALRQEHFPRERNFLPAHITLFHDLPGGQVETIADQLLRLADRTAPIQLSLPKLRFLGKGVAINVTSPQLIELRNELAADWLAWLTPQDRQKYSPHITVQNKADPAAARRLFHDLSTSWAPLAGSGVALLLWWYRGGPWEAAGRFEFGGSGE